MTLQTTIVINEKILKLGILYEFFPNKSLVQYLLVFLPSNYFRLNLYESVWIIISERLSLCAYASSASIGTVVIAYL